MELAISFIEAHEVPPADRISAVFLLAFRNGRILAIRNERGWDIPGGHLEPGEQPMAALDREIREEASAACLNVSPFAILRSPASEGPVMLIFAGDGYALHDFVPARDCFERAELNPEVLIERYHGNTELLRLLIQAAARTIRCESAQMYTIPSS